MKRQLIWLLAAALTGACAEGRPTPAVTGMVEIREGLEFDFGPDAPCNQDGTEDVCTVQNLELRAGNDVYPQVRVKLEPFAIDVHEVTNVQYEFCEDMGACPAHEYKHAITSEQDPYYEEERFYHYPVVHVTWEAARKYCEFVGKRLPSEFEWERVAKGNPDAGKARKYPAENMTDSINRCKTLALPTDFCSNDNNLERAPELRADDTYFSTTEDYVIEVVEGEEKRIYHLFGNAGEWTSTWLKDDLTCKGPAPCTECWDCSSSDTDCWNQCATNCDECVGCPNCIGKDCFYVCEGKTNESIACEAYPPDKVFTAEELAPGPDDPGVKGLRVVRGGSALEGERACLARSTGRDHHKNIIAPEPTNSHQWLGFRCAMDLEPMP